MWRRCERELRHARAGDGPGCRRRGTRAPEVVGTGSVEALEVVLGCTENRGDLIARRSERWKSAATR